MPTGQERGYMKEDVNNTDELGRSKQQRYNKRRRGNEVDLLHSCNARVPPTKKREALDDKEQEEIRLGEIRSSFEDPIGENSDRAAAPFSASADHISELIPFPRLAPTNLESLRRVIAQSHLANTVARMPPLVHYSSYPNFNLPVMGMPLLQYDPILGWRTAELYAQPETNSFHDLLPSLGGHANHFNEFSVAAHLASLEILQHNNMQNGGQLSLLTPARAAVTRQDRSHEENSFSQLAGLSRPIRAYRKMQKGRQSRHGQDQNNKDDSSTPGMTLYISEDRGKLNDNQIFLRRQIEIFRASKDDILNLTRGKNKPIVLQQVGIRCRHCSNVSMGRRRKGSTYFPSNLMGIYQAAQNMSVEHLQSGLCTELPPDVKERCSGFGSGKSVASCAGKQYWAEAGRMLGLIDTDDGIRFAGDVDETMRLACQSF